MPTGREWYHEVKYDGYRLLVQREGKRIRLLTRNGHDRTDRYPLIVEGALRNRQTSFVIDGEAVLLGVDGVSDFNGLHSRKYNDEVQLYAFDVLALGGDDLQASIIDTQIKPGTAASAAAGWDLRRAIRKRRDRLRPIPGCLQVRIGRAGI